MNEKINITKMDGAKVYSDLVCFIENTTNSKRYVYHTLNEIVGAGPNSTVKIYVSKIKQDDPTLDNPITEEDWNVLKGYMGDALKGNSNPEIKYIAPNELGEPFSVSDRAIAMPTSYDYINKQRGIYAQAIATAPSTEQTTSQESAPEPDTPTIPEVQIETTQAEPVSSIISEADLSAPIPEVPQATPAVDLNPAAENSTNTPVEPTPITNAAPEIAPMEQQVQPTPVPEATENIVLGAQTEATPVLNETPINNALEDEKPLDNIVITDNNNSGLSDLTPISIDEIEKKYDDMIASLNDLRNKELEAAKRYNATIELSSMHKEQHANYVQNEQLKEVVQNTNVIDSQTPTMPVDNVGTVPNPQPMPTLTVEPIKETVQQVVEPTPVTPENLETNWFDMPNN